MKSFLSSLLNNQRALKKEESIIKKELFWCRLESFVGRKVPKTSFEELFYAYLSFIFHSEEGLLAAEQAERGDVDEYRAILDLKIDFNNYLAYEYGGMFSVQDDTLGEFTLFSEHQIVRIKDMLPIIKKRAELNLPFTLIVSHHKYNSGIMVGFKVHQQTGLMNGRIHFKNYAANIAGDDQNIINAINDYFSIDELEQKVHEIKALFNSMAKGEVNG